MEEKTVRNSRVILTHLMGPQDANILGNVHGGVIMKICDEAGAMSAIKHARRSVVTVTVDSMSFHSPVHIGNLMKVTAEVSWVGRTSLESHVVVQAENVYTGEIIHTNTAYFVYVALDEQGSSTAVPPLICESDAEKNRCQQAVVRQQNRLNRIQKGDL